MAIVSTERGGLILCPGGNFLTGAKEQAVKALSWAQVKQIVRSFEALNPYQRDIIPGSVLKIEDDNYDPKTGKQRQIYCYAISAKRYALFLWPRGCKPALLREKVNNTKDRWSRHGLGHLLNPTDPEASDRNWTAAVWETILRKGCGFRTTDLKFAHLPAVGRTTVSSPFLMKSFETLNAGKSYAEQIKPFNFLLTAQVIPFGHPESVDPEKFHLITPYDSDPRNWFIKEWIDQYSKKRFRITTLGHCGSRQTARVKTYGDVVTEYEFHPEAKCADVSGNTCEKQTVGLLQRRRIKVDLIKCIGKESNSLESVDEGMVHSKQNVYTEYADPRRTEWFVKIQPALKKAKLKSLVRLCKNNLSRREIIELRAGRSKPRRKTLELLKSVLGKLGFL
jgi:hypothetical protein